MPEPVGTGHLVLVGMMGSGKTTVGRRIAGRLDRPFVDGDAELVAVTGRDIPTWFAEEGEAAFRRAEEDVMARICGRTEPHVVATGGGVVLSAVTRDLLAEPRHTVVWLRASPAFLTSRVTRNPDRGRRPLLGDDAADTLARLDARRRDLYAEVADVIVDVEPPPRRGDHPRDRIADLVVDTLAHTSPGAWA